MIEFNGYISGVAKKRFENKARSIGQNIMLFSVLIFMPIVIIIGIQMKNLMVVILYCSLFIIIPLLSRIPNSKKGKKELTPKRIYTEEEYIVCVADKYEEYRLITDAKKVYDFGEFYEIVFPLGKVSDKFICQKNLLVKGTLEDFEKLFEGKIERKC